MKKLILIPEIAASTGMACTGIGVSHADGLHPISDNILTTPYTKDAEQEPRAMGMVVVDH